MLVVDKKWEKKIKCIARVCVFDRFNDAKKQWDGQ